MAADVREHACVVNNVAVEDGSDWIKAYEHADDEECPGCGQESPRKTDGVHGHTAACVCPRGRYTCRKCASDRAIGYICKCCDVLVPVVVHTSNIICPHVIHAVSTYDWLVILVWYTRILQYSRKEFRDQRASGGEAEDCSDFIGRQYREALEVTKETWAAYEGTGHIDCLDVIRADLARNAGKPCTSTLARLAKWLQLASKAVAFNVHNRREDVESDETKTARREMLIVIFIRFANSTESVVGI